MSLMQRSVYFIGARKIAVRESPLPPTPADAVLVQTRTSAISAGTEMLVYRNQMPHGIATDSTITALDGTLAYPLKYGYATVGTVIDVGKNVSAKWMGRTVFAFNPHESHFHAHPGNLHPIDKISADDALFLPNMETAVNFLMDGQPMIGENVVVFGQGIVGLLTTALLAKMPLARLIVLDGIASRRKMALSLGAHNAIDPTHPDAMTQVQSLLGGADLAFEVSGAPAALNQAIAATGFGGRVVIGSWYGTKPVALDLGGTFHRSRIKLIASQVSTIAPNLSGRWDKARRFDVVWKMLADVRPSRFITHRFPADNAAQAYDTIDQHPADILQVVLDWENS